MIPDTVLSRRKARSPTRNTGKVSRDWRSTSRLDTPAWKCTHTKTRTHTRAQSLVCGERVFLTACILLLWLLEKTWCRCIMVRKPCDMTTIHLHDYYLSLFIYIFNFLKMILPVRMKVGWRENQRGSSRDMNTAKPMLKMFRPESMSVYWK